MDGRYHEATSDEDLERDKNLAQYNLTIIRFSESEVLMDMFNVLRTLEAYLEEYINRVS